MPGVRSAICTQPLLYTTVPSIKHTLQVNSSLRRRQRKPMQFRPSLRIELGFSRPFDTDSIKQRLLASGSSDGPITNAETYGA